MTPPPTILNHLGDHGARVLSIGKISDIFAGSGIHESHPTHCNAEGMQVIGELWAQPRDQPTLAFANLVDFDMLYGHRRDPAGYAGALAAFDSWLDGFLPKCRPDDLVIITADHGNDPTWRGTDHTREQVPLFVATGGRHGSLGPRDSFADIAASLATFFNSPPWPAGKSFL